MRTGDAPRPVTRHVLAFLAVLVGVPVTTAVVVLALDAAGADVPDLRPGAFMTAAWALVTLSLVRWWRRRGVDADERDLHYYRLALGVFAVLGLLARPYLEAVLAGGLLLATWVGPWRPAVPRTPRLVHDADRTDFVELSPAEAEALGAPLVLAGLSLGAAEAPLLVAVVGIVLDGSSGRTDDDVVREASRPPEGVRPTYVGPVEPVATAPGWQRLRYDVRGPEGAAVSRLRYHRDLGDHRHLLVLVGDADPTTLAHVLPTVDDAVATVELR